MNLDYQQVFEIYEGKTSMINILVSMILCSHEPDLLPTINWHHYVFCRSKL